MKIGLVLSGGGARGIVHAQVLQVFDELGIKPYMIAGTSMGALLGGLYCCGMTGKEIEEEFLKINYLSFFMGDIAVGFNGIVRGNVIEKTIRKFVGVRKIEELPIKFCCVATDFWARKPFAFKKGDFVKSVRASISIPGVFVPVKIDGKYYVDGGISNNLPVSCLSKACDFVITVNVNKGNYERTMHKPNIVESIMFSYEISQDVLTSLHTKDVKVDIALDYPNIKYDLVEFNKLKKILRESEGVTKKFKKELIRKLGLGKKK